MNEQPKPCPVCGDPLKEGAAGSHYCKNGCSIYTAQSSGSTYQFQGSLFGTEGCTRKVPTSEVYK